MTHTNYNFEIADQKKYNPIVTWLGIGIVMLMIQIILGGITRLTGAGLSITEWKPLMGALPPLNNGAWEKSFEKYQHIAQFKKVNSSFTLTDYKSIFFWEWLHREWARLMGLVFIVPFLFFIWQKKISKKLVKPLIILFLLGGLQGIIGWIMVKSGLNDSDITVNHIRLAVHFLFAIFLLSYLLWFLLKISIKKEWTTKAPAIKWLNLGLLLLIMKQLTYGVFMAGTHAALYAPTWPDINGAFFPSVKITSLTVIHQLCYNPLIIQFVHRTLAYLIAILILIWYFMVGKLDRNIMLHR